MALRDNHRKTEAALTLAALGVLLFALLLVYSARAHAEPQDALAINEATAEQFAQAFGISKESGTRIVEARQRLGGFESCDQLLEIAAPVSAAPAPVKGAHRTPLLDSLTIRPLLKRCIVRSSGTVFRHFWIGAGILILAMLFVTPWMRAKLVGGDPYLLPITLLLSGLGVAMLFSLKDPLRDRMVAEHHLAGILASLFVFVIAARISPVARLGIRRYQYVWVIGAGLLVLALLIFGSGPEGVKLNLFHFQPVEIIKLLLVFFLASALADRASLIADTSRPISPSERGGRRLLALSLPRRQDIGPLAVMFAGALLLFFVIKDLGPGLLLFATFVTTLYLMTGRASFLTAGLLLILVGGLLGYSRHIGVFATRVDMWLHPFANSHPNGMQLGEAQWGMASGGWQGSGLGLGMPGLLSRGGSDLAFASWAEETGLIGAWLVLILYAVLVWRGLRIALHARNDFDRALAFGLTALLGLQTLLILAGVTGAFPLTGISLPFLSYGNSALVAAFLIAGLLRGISAPPASGVGNPEPPEEIRMASRRFGYAFTLLLLGGIGLWKLGQVQLLHADAIALQPIRTPDADKVTRNHINPRLLAMERDIPRGSIYDRTGRVLATSREGELTAFFEKHKAQRMADTRSRYYPFGPATAQLIGYLDPGVGGPSGFENRYNNELRGFHSYAELLDDYRRRHSFGFQPRKGYDLYLTLDAALQKEAQAILAKTIAHLKDKETGKPKDRAAFVLMNPQTGAVLVAASLPTYDPNALTPEQMQRFTTGEDAKTEIRLLNRAVRGYYPPGSTLKVATTACALENMPNALQFTVACNQTSEPIHWETNGVRHVRRSIKDDKGDPAFGTIALPFAFQVSSNIYFANLAASLGSVPLRTTLAEKFGFSHTPKPEYFDADLPDIGFGQGRMLASPLEMCRMAAGVANNGQMMQEQFVTRIALPGEKPEPVEKEVKDKPPMSKTFVPTLQSQVMSSQSAGTLHELMRSVVTNGTARGVFNNMPFAVAGKTGTAQNHQYDHEPHSWFIGFAPYAEHPRFAFACVVENGGYGKTVAAVICRDVLQKAASH